MVPGSPPPFPRLRRFGSLIPFGGALRRREEDRRVTAGRHIQSLRPLPEEPPEHDEEAEVKDEDEDGDDMNDVFQNQNWSP